MSFSQQNKLRTGHFCSVMNLTKVILSPTFKKFGIIDSKLFSEWHNIIDMELAQKAIPFKISIKKHLNNKIKILHLIVNDSSTAFVVNYQKEFLIKKIGFYFGTNFINDIKTLVKNDFFLKTQPEILEVTNTTPCSFDINGIDDENLKRTLIELGKMIR